MKLRRYLCTSYLVATKFSRDGGEKMQQTKDVVNGLVVIMLCYFAGELLSEVSGLPLPGNLIGLVLLGGLLVSGLVKLEWVDKTASFLVQNLALILVPLAVTFMQDWELVAHDLLAIVVSIVLSTFLVMLVTAKTMEFLQRKGQKSEASNH